MNSYPATPTTAEAGLPGLQAALWYGLWVRTGTPEEIRARLNEAMRETLADPKIEKRLFELGVEITPKSQQSAEDLRSFQKAEADHWWPIIKAANIKAQ